MFVFILLLVLCPCVLLDGNKAEAGQTFDLARARIIEETMSRLEREMKEAKDPEPVASSPSAAQEDTTEIPALHRSSPSVFESRTDRFYLEGSEDSEDFLDGPEESGRLLKADLQILTGFRQDDFDWNIAADLQGGTPNILSELTWSDLSMTQIKTKGRLTFKDHFVLDGMAAYADIYSGENQDSDYSGNNRTSEFSRSNNSSDDGEAMDLSAGVGYKIYLGREPYLLNVDHLWLTVLGGYSYHELNLVMTDGFQTIPATGAFTGLHSSYWAEWDGPWFGTELFGKKNKLSGLFRFEYHWADYYGSANWNLRSDFQHPKSYEHLADGRGLVFNLGTAYHFNDRWSLDFNADIQDWKTTKGIDRTFFSTGTISETQLNEVHWGSYAVMFGTTCRF
jgi:hypothetical protein